jgi:hypothetical protein
MALQTVTSIRKAGIVDLDAELTAADVAGDSVNSSSGIFVVLKNDDASPHTLTVTASVASVDCGNYGDVPLDDVTLVVAAGDIGFVSIPSGYSQNGLDSWTYDAVTSVSIGVFSISP